MIDRGGVMEYELGKHITLDKDGKLALKGSKIRLIKLADREIEKWQEFRKNLIKDKGK